MHFPGVHTALPSQDSFLSMVGNSTKSQPPRGGGWFSRDFLQSLEILIWLTVTASNNANAGIAAVHGTSTSGG